VEEIPVISIFSIISTFLMMRKSNNCDGLLF
jgi:hypothetical protein